MHIVMFSQRPARRIYVLDGVYADGAWTSKSIAYRLGTVLGIPSGCVSMEYIGSEDRWIAKVSMPLLESPVFSTLDEAIAEATKLKLMDTHLVHSIVEIAPAPSTPVCTVRHTVRHYNKDTRDEYTYMGRIYGALQQGYQG